MRIAIDVIAIMNPGARNRGIGIYTLNLLEALFELDKKNEYYLFNIYENTSLKEILNYGENVKEIFYETGFSTKIRETKAYNVIIGSIVNKFIQTYQIEYFYITSPFDNLFNYHEEWIRPAKILGTVFDLIPLVMRNIYLKNRNARNEYEKRLELIKKFDVLYAISNSARIDLQKYLSIPSEKIVSIYSGIDDLYTEKKYSDEEIEKLKIKFNIQDKYVMMTGGNDHRKNMDKLILAYSMLPGKLKNIYQLVIVCKLSNHLIEYYSKIAKDNHVLDRVVFTNFVTQDELLLLYNEAYVMAFPSLYEGFGLPVVEAMACGTLVVTSNNSSLKEIAEGSAILVDAKNVKSITKGLEEALLLNPEEYDYFIEKGFEVVNKYTWKKTAQLLLDSINTLPENVFTKNEKRINRIAIFTPLSIKNRLNTYLVSCLNESAIQSEIDFFTETDIKNKDIKAKTYHHKAFHELKNQYQEVIYILENDNTCSYMINYLQKYKGTVVLVDYNLHNLALDISFNKKKIDSYAKILYEDYAKEDVNKYIYNLKKNRFAIDEINYMCNGFVTNYAKRVIVFDPYYKELLLKRNFSLNVFDVKMPINFNNNYDLNQVKEDNNFYRFTYLITIIGYINETKRILSLLKVVEKLVEKHSNILFQIAGIFQIEYLNEIKRTIKENNLNNYVKIVSDNQYENLYKIMQASDLIIDLNTPYNGMSLGYMADAFGLGKAVIINEAKIYADIPRDAAYKIPDFESLTKTEEINYLYDAVIKMMDKDYANNFSSKALEYVKTKKLKNNCLEELYNLLQKPLKTSKVTNQVLDELYKTIIDEKITDPSLLFKLSMTIAYAKNDDLVVDYDKLLNENKKSEVS